jgi:hypothetical protein
MRKTQMGTFAFGKRGSDGLFIREGFLGLRDRVFFANKKCRLCKKIQTQRELDEESATT